MTDLPPPKPRLFRRFWRDYLRPETGMIALAFGLMLIEGATLGALARAIEPLFDDVRKRFGTQVTRYSLYGHSAGAQFVHRYVLFMPEARLDKAVAAELGYTRKASVQQGGAAVIGLLIDEVVTTPFAPPFIEGARLVTFDGAESFLAALGPDLASGRDLILVCRSGRRTAAAADALAGVIPNRIISVDGGMIAVVQGGYSPVPAR